MLDLYIDGIKKKTYTNTKLALKASNSIKNNNMIYISDKNRKVEIVKNKDYGDTLVLIDGNILATLWNDGDLTLVKNIETIKGVFNFKYDHEAWMKYYMMLRDLDVVSENEYIVLVDAIKS